MWIGESRHSDALEQAVGREIKKLGKIEGEIWGIQQSDIVLARNDRREKWRDF